MNKKTITIVLVIAVLAVAGYYAFDFFKKKKDLEAETARVIASPAMREQASQMAAKNGTSLQREAEIIAARNLK